MVLTDVPTRRFMSNADSTSSSVWPVKSHQMSIKVAQKWFHYKKDRFWHLYKNCLTMWMIGQINCCQRLWKVAQSTINRPIWSHWLSFRDVKHMNKRDASVVIFRSKIERETDHRRQVTRPRRTLAWKIYCNLN